MAEMESWCPLCGEAVSEVSLHVCAICRRLTCQRCAVRDFGRTFCSQHCRDLFFFGDDEEPEDEGEGGG